MADASSFSLFSWLTGRNKVAKQPRQSTPTPTDAPAEPFNATEIALAADGKAIAAIRAYRERTGAGLKEAKQALDAAQAPGPDAERANRHAAPSPSAPGEAALTPEELALIANGRKIAAIRAYRERTGVGLKEAKALVDSSDNSQGR